MTQDTEFEKWWNKDRKPVPNDPDREFAKYAFRAGRIVQREKDAEIADAYQDEFCKCAAEIRSQEI